MRLFRVLFALDAIAAAIVLFFFVWGLADGTVSAFNILLWLALLAVPAAILAGGLALRARGAIVPANLLLAVLAVPALLVGLFFVVLIVAQPRWN